MLCKYFSNIVPSLNIYFALAHTAIFRDYVHLHLALVLFFFLLVSWTLCKFQWTEQTEKQGHSLSVSEVISNLCINKKHRAKNMLEGWQDKTFLIYYRDTVLGSPRNEIHIMMHMNLPFKISGCFSELIEE